MKLNQKEAIRKRKSNVKESAMFVQNGKQTGKEKENLRLV